ncbi:MAG: Fe-S cluster assembly protein SufB, partial [Candidatus Nanohaloarchaea archaeon]
MSQEVQKNQERFDHRTDAEIKVDTGKGLSEEVVRTISREKDEPEWMLEKRLQAYRHFRQRPMPDWGPDLSELDFDEITPFMVAEGEQSDSWEEVPEEIKDTFDKLGIPEAEKEALAGAGAQYESQVVYQDMKEQWEEKGVIFMDMDKALQEHEELVKEYFMKKC